MEQICEIWKTCHIHQPFLMQTLVFMCLKYKSFENTVGKGKNLSQQAISSFPIVFSTLLENFLRFSSNMELSSANSFSLEESNICCLGKGYKRYCNCQTFCCKHTDTETGQNLYAPIECGGIMSIPIAEVLYFIWNRNVYLSLSQTSSDFYVSAVQVYWKHSGKRRNCSQQAISPFPTVFATLRKNFLPFLSNLKIVVCKLF